MCVCVQKGEKSAALFGDKTATGDGCYSIMERLRPEGYIESATRELFFMGIGDAELSHA